MKNYIKRVWQAFVIQFFKGIFGAARVVPMSWLMKWAVMMGRFGYRASKRYRNVGLKNLNIAYGDTLSDKEKHRIVEQVFVTFAKSSLAEFPYLETMTDDEMRRKVKLRDEDLAYLKERVAGGKGLLLVTGHFGNFEIAARRLIIEGLKFSLVLRRDNNAAFADYFYNLYRRIGVDLLDRGNAIRNVMRLLRDGSVVAMLPDQKSEDVWVPFFGRLSGTVAGPAVIALRTGAPIVCGFCIRQPDDTHVIEVYPEIEVVSTGDQKADSTRIMTEINVLLENMIREHPEQWLWLHDRWKVAPPPEELEKWQNSQK